MASMKPGQLFDLIYYNSRAVEDFSNALANCVRVHRLEMYAPTVAADEFAVLAEEIHAARLLSCWDRSYYRQVMPVLLNSRS